MKGFIMKNKQEFMTTIYVDYSHETKDAPVACELGVTEDESVKEAIKSFEKKGYWVDKLIRMETLQIPQRYTATEMA